MAPITWCALAVAIIGFASAASLPKHPHKRQIITPTEPDEVSTQRTEGDDQKINFPLTETVFFTPEIPSPALASVVLIETKSSKTIIPVRNPTPQEAREERVFLVFPEPPTSSTTEAVPEITTLPENPDVEEGDEFTTLANILEENQKVAVTVMTEIEGREAEDDNELGETTTLSSTTSEEPTSTTTFTTTQEPSSTTTTTEEPTSTTNTTPTTTSTSPPSTTTSSTTTPETTTPGSTTVKATARAYRGTPRTPKKVTTTTVAPVTSSTPKSNVTESSDKSDESPESEEDAKVTTTHKTPHFSKKESTLKPAPRPSARLVEFLKKKTPGSNSGTKRFQPSQSAEPAAPSTTPTPSTTTTETPVTTIKPRRTNVLGSRGKPKMLERSLTAEPEVLTPEESNQEMRRARFFSSASSMLSGFVPSVQLPRASVPEMAKRNSRSSCANPAACISPEKAEALMEAVQETIRNNSLPALVQAQTPVSSTTNAIRSRLQTRRPVQSRRRTTTVAPTTTSEVTPMRSGAQRLAHRRRMTSTTTTTTTTSTTMPSVMTMKQIQDIVVTPAPFTVAQEVASAPVVQPTMTFRPLLQQLKAVERKFIPTSKGPQPHFRPQQAVAEN